MDDDESGADALVTLLTAMGHEARAAYCAEDALGVARQFNPDLIFLDLEMPRMNGIEAAQCLTQDFLCRRATLVAITGRTDPSARMLTQQAGCVLHLTKPVGIESLKTVLASDPASD